MSKAKKAKLDLAGVGVDVVTGEQRPVLNGADIFRLMDTHGLPLSVASMAMCEKGLAFDVLGFCEAARASGNYSRRKLAAMFREEAIFQADRDGYLRKVEAVLDGVFSEGVGA